MLTASGRADDEKRPNIVLILADDVGCETIGAYGGERWETPNIDALAEGGMCFEHCYSMPVCHPARVCLLTGRYPFRLKSRWGTFPQEEEQNTLAAVLKRSGYRTAIAGKWQLGLMKNDTQQPARLGFDAWSVFGWHEGARYHDPMIYQNGSVRADTAGTYGPDLYVDFLSDFMEDSGRNNQPFFAFYSMALAHDVTDDLPVQVPYVPGRDRWMNYGEMIESMDAMVGRLVNRLDELGLRENTIVFFTGDNGTAVRTKQRHLSDRDYENEVVYSIRSGQRVSGGKGRLTNSGTNVPLIVNWPSRIRPAVHTESLVDFSDWLPTLAEIADTEPTTDIDGVSFAAELFGRQPHRFRSFAFSERKNGSAWVRSKRYKLYNDGRFFDIPADLMEQHPITQVTKSTAAERQRLQEALTNLGYPTKKTVESR